MSILPSDARRERHLLRQRGVQRRAVAERFGFTIAVSQPCAESLDGETIVQTEGVVELPASHLVRAKVPSENGRPADDVAKAAIAKSDGLTRREPSFSLPANVARARISRPSRPRASPNTGAKRRPKARQRAQEESVENGPSRRDEPEPAPAVPLPLTSAALGKRKRDDGDDTARASEPDLRLVNAPEQLKLATDANSANEHQLRERKKRVKRDSLDSAGPSKQSQSTSLLETQEQPRMPKAEPSGEANELAMDQTEDQPAPCDVDQVDGIAIEALVPAELKAQDEAPPQDTEPPKAPRSRNTASKSKPGRQAPTAAAPASGPAKVKLFSDAQADDLLRPLLDRQRPAAARTPLQPRVNLLHTSTGKARRARTKADAGGGGADWQRQDWFQASVPAALLAPAHADTTMDGNE